MHTKHINIFVLFFVFTIFLGCKNEKDTEILQIENAIETSELDTGKYKWVVVLPGLGCHGCIQEAEAFMKKHIKNNNILFVLTKIESLKILQQKTGIKFKIHTNIYVDRENLFDFQTNNSIYPCIIQLENNSIKNYQFQSPSNSQAFWKLKKQISSIPKSNL